MLIITEALEAEGYGPTQATVDEVIRHLWWKKERIFGELQTAKQTLNKTLGKDQFQVVQVRYLLNDPVPHYCYYLVMCAHVHPKINFEL